MHRRPLAALALLAAGAPWTGALAQASATRVQLQGTMGARSALLLIDGEPRAVQVGGSALGVNLLALDDGRATVELGGQRLELTLGAAPARLAPNGSTAGRQIVLPMGSGGHFTSTGAINGRATQFMVDTGATFVALSQGEADRLGLKYQTGRRVATQTANGIAAAYGVQLATVRIGDVELRNVEAIVVPGAMPQVLLGNSFLTRFQMRRENDVMTLDLRY